MCDRRKEMLQDIAVLTGGQVISEELGLDLKETTMDQLGRANPLRYRKRIQSFVDGLRREERDQRQDRSD